MRRASRFDFARVHEEGTGLMQEVEPLEVEISAVHHVDGTGLGDQQVETATGQQAKRGALRPQTDAAATTPEGPFEPCRNPSRPPITLILLTMAALSLLRWR